MKRSVLNAAYRAALDCFTRHHWTLPPNPAWDITDFGLDEFDRHGLILVNLAAEPEYCEKLMFAFRGQTTPCHTHAKKKEDIICRTGALTVQLWPGCPTPEAKLAPSLTVPVNGVPTTVNTGEAWDLPAGSRVTLVPGVWHAFWPAADDTIIGEVSTANDDLNDNFFLNPDIGRFPGIEEDESPAIRLIGEKAS
jgi:D-lyxose ketol-isomerase